MNGCIYRTKYGECMIPSRSAEYGPMCRSDCTDKHPSNADRIRAMSDEELADELLTAFAAFYEVEWSKDAVFDWLKREATE